MNIHPLGPNLVKVALAGRLDTPGVDRIETRFIAALVPGAKNAIVDLSQVDFVASMGIRMLLSAARNLHARHAALVLFGAQDMVGQVFDSVSLKQIIPICKNETEALLAVAAPRA